MNSRTLLLTAILPPTALLWIAGCGAPSASPPADRPAKSHAGHAGHEHAGHDHGDHDHGPAGEVAEALAQLSSEDRAAAEKQKNCPVTNEPLGSMGVPTKVTAKGREVFLCCQGCEEEFRKKVDEYLARLPK